MKYTRRIMGVLLALMMVMGLMTATALAAEADLSNHTYKAYQIFSGTQAEDSEKLGQIVWGSGINIESFLTALKADESLKGTFENCTTAADVAKAMENWADKSDNAKAFAAHAYKHIITTPVDMGIECENGTTALDAGYYLVVDTTTFEDDTENTVVNTALLQLTKKGTFEIANKTDVPEVEKKIVEGENKADVNEAAIGEDVKYEITGTMPTNIADYKEYYYVFTDTLSSGLTYKELNSITVNGKDVTKYFYDKDTVNEDGTTTIVYGMSDLLALENLADPEVGKITANSTVVITYTATVNEKAIIDGANPNEVKLDYSNNPNQSGDGTPATPPENPEDVPSTENPKGETPKDKVEMFVTEVHINKIDGEGNALTGATFEITGTALKTVLVTTFEFSEDNTAGTHWKLKDGTYTTQDPNGKITDAEGNEVDVDTSAYESTTVKYTMTEKTEKKVISDAVKASGAVGEDGKLTVTGLAEGEYTIKETVTPAGYNTVADITLKVGFNEISKTFTYTWSGGASGNLNTIEVVNQAGSTLPETGGMGTTLFYIVGGLLVAAAVVLLVTKRRMGAAE